MPLTPTPTFLHRGGKAIESNYLEGGRSGGVVSSSASRPRGWRSRKGKHLLCGSKDHQDRHGKCWKGGGMVQRRWLVVFTFVALALPFTAVCSAGTPTPGPEATLTVAVATFGNERW